MGTFEDRMETACAEKEIPGAVLVAGDKSGKFQYAEAFGLRTLKDQSNPEPLTLDATMWLASCTKLMTTVAAMQCVERGQLSLDADVTSFLPELKGLEILTGFEEGSDKPIMARNDKIITLRHLLTHSSGLGYDIFNPVLKRYRNWQGIPIPIGAKLAVKEACVLPLLFAPGDGWEYGVGIEWAGQMVERVNGNVSLEAYLEKNVWGPLGIGSMTFHPASNTTVRAKLADTSQRDGAMDPVFGITLNPEGKVIYVPGLRIWDFEVNDCYGGGGGFGSMLEYQKLLQSICSDDAKVLKSSTLDEMFKPQLSNDSRKSLMAKLTIKELNQVFGGLPAGTKVDWGLGGMLNLEDVRGRKAGSLTWGGFPNLTWWIDRMGGICGIYGSQINPPGDPKTTQLFYLWQEEMYKRVGLKEKL